MPVARLWVRRSPVGLGKRQVRPSSRPSGWHDMQEIPRPDSWCRSRTARPVSFSQVSSISTVFPDSWKAVGCASRKAGGWPGCRATDVITPWMSSSGQRLMPGVHQASVWRTSSWNDVKFRRQVCFPGRKPALIMRTSCSSRSTDTSTGSGGMAKAPELRGVCPDLNQLTALKTIPPQAGSSAGSGGP